MYCSTMVIAKTIMPTIIAGLTTLTAENTSTGDTATANINPTPWLMLFVIFSPRDCTPGDEGSLVMETYHLFLRVQLFPDPGPFEFQIQRYFYLSCVTSLVLFFSLELILFDVCWIYNLILPSCYLHDVLFNNAIKKRIPERNLLRIKIL